MTNIDGLFPIENNTACKLKWSWSTVRLYEGTTASCHRCKYHPIEIEIFNIHNTLDKINQRKAMLDNEWPKDIGCEFCEHIELANGVSDRIFQKSITGYPEELVSSTNNVIVTPTILEVYFDNKCNLSCVYCIPKFSSRIHAEMKKYGDFASNINSKTSLRKMDTKDPSPIFSNTNKHAQYDIIKQKFWKWMEQHSSKLLRFHILGGEPFFQNDLNDVIRHFIQIPNDNLEMNIVSNLSIKPTMFKLVIDKFKYMVESKKIKRLDITCSIDAWAEDQTYVRYGLNMRWFEQNMQYMLKQDDWLRININQTVSVLTIKNMSKLNDKINIWKKQKNIAQYMGFVRFWDCLHPKIFDYSVWQSSFDSITKSMISHTWDDKQSINLLDGIIKYLQQNASDDNIQQANMKLYLDELDRRRGTNWRTIFPYLDI